MMQAQKHAVNNEAAKLSTIKEVNSMLKKVAAKRMSDEALDISEECTMAWKKVAAAQQKQATSSVNTKRAEYLKEELE